MSQWKSAVEATATHARLLVTDSEGCEILKAILPVRPYHPRALLTLLEGLALWSGHPLTAVISVGGTSQPPTDSLLFGADLCPCDSALVRYDIAEPRRRRRTLSGLGDFRHLRLIQRGR